MAAVIVCVWLLTQTEPERVACGALAVAAGLSVYGAGAACDGGARWRDGFGGSVKVKAEGTGRRCAYSGDLELEVGMAEQSNRAKQEAEIVQRAIEDGAFRQELVANPKAVIERTLGKKFPDSLSVKVVEEDSDNLCIVIPAALADELGDGVLEDVAGGMVKGRGKGRDIGGQTLKPFGGRPVNQCLDDFWFI